MSRVLEDMLTGTGSDRSTGRHGTLGVEPVPDALPSATVVDRAVRMVAGLGLWAGLLLVISWWVLDGGIQALTSWTGGLTSAGRIFGLVGAQLVLAQVLLMARIPWLEHAYGRVRMIKLHRVIGFTSFSFVMAHIVTIVGGYASAQWSLVGSTLWQLVTAYAGMLLATAAAVCMILVVATSIRAARRRLRYESWHLLHLYGYLGAGLAIPHQLWNGQEFASRPAAVVYWWSLWALVAAAVITWRIGLPLVRALRHQLRVVSVSWESDDVVSVVMTGPRLNELAIEAGQFINVRFLIMPGWTRANPFSLSAAPDGRTLRITAKVVGDGTERIARLHPGTRVLFEGPYGRLSGRARTRRKVLLIGAGAGITPLRALAEGLTYQAGEAALLYRYSETPLFAREFERLHAERGLQIVALPGRRRRQGSIFGPTADDGDELDLLTQAFGDLADRDVFICGPDGWARAVVALLSRAGVAAGQIHLESFAW